MGPLSINFDGHNNSCEPQNIFRFTILSKVFRDLPEAREHVMYGFCHRPQWLKPLNNAKGLTAHWMRSAGRPEAALTTFLFIYFSARKVIRLGAEFF